VDDVCGCSVNDNVKIWRGLEEELVGLIGFQLVWGCCEREICECGER
jgi:hypothetical protein